MKLSHHIYATTAIKKYQDLRSARNAAEDNNEYIKVLFAGVYQDSDFSFAVMPAILKELDRRIQSARVDLETLGVEIDE